MPHLGLQSHPPRDEEEQQTTPGQPQPEEQEDRQDLKAGPQQQKEEKEEPVAADTSFTREQLRRAEEALAEFEDQERQAQEKKQDRKKQEKPKEEPAQQKEKKDKDDLTAEEKKEAEEAGLVTAGEEEREERGKRPQEVIEEAKQSLNEEEERVNEVLNDAQAKLDVATAGVVESIKSIYAARKQEQKEINESRMEQLEQQGIRLGTARFAPQVNTSILAAQEEENLEKLQELDAQEAQAIAEAKQAQTQKEAQLMQKKVDNVRSIQKQRRNLLSKQAELAQKKREAASNQKNGVRRDIAISQLVSQGVTDTNTVFRTLQANGIDTTLEETKSSLETITETDGSKQLSFSQLRQLNSTLPEDSKLPVGTTISEARELGLAPPPKTKDLKGDIGEFMQAKQAGIISQDTTFFDYIRRKKRAKGSEDSTGEAIVDLRQKVLQEPSVKRFSVVKNGFQNVQEGVKLGNAQGDLAIVNGIAKMLDPTGVVRPSEFETVGSAQSFIQQITNLPVRATEGDTLKPAVRSKFLELGRALMVRKGEPVVDDVEAVFGPVAREKGVDVTQLAPEIKAVRDIQAELGGREEAQQKAKEVTEKNVKFDMDRLSPQQLQQLRNEGLL